MIKRILYAWQVLMGQRLTPLQIEAEWLEYKLVFQDLLERWSAMLARQAKMERKRQERIQEAVEAPIVPPQDNGSKAAVRAAAARLQGLAGYQNQLNLRTGEE